MAIWRGPSRCLSRQMPVYCVLGPGTALFLHTSHGTARAVLFLGPPGPCLIFSFVRRLAVVLLRQRCVKCHKILVCHRKQNIPDVFPYRACISDPKIVSMLASMSESFAIILFRCTMVVYLFFKIVSEYLFSL